MILGYTRVSTTEQAAADRTSLAEQERVIRGLAMTRGASSYDVAIYSDPGISGSIALRNRPAGARLLADVNPSDVVVAAKLDRMFRDALDAQETYRDFKTKGIDLILYDLGPDPVTKTGGLSKVFFQIVSVFADAERERISERMRDGKRLKKEKGLHIGGSAPFGWRIIGKGREAKLEENPSEQAAIRVARDMWQAYQSIATVCDQLDKQGIRDRAGSPLRPIQLKRLLARAS